VSGCVLLHGGRRVNGMVGRREQATGPTRLVLVALPICVLFGVPGCGLPIVYLVVIGGLSVGSRVDLCFQSLLR